MSGAKGPTVYMVLAETIDAERPSGTRSYVYNLARTLAHSHEVFLVTPPPCDAKAIAEQGLKNIPVRSGGRLSSIGFMLNVVLGLRRLRLRAGSIVHAHRTDSLLPFALFRKNAVKVLTVHGMPNVRLRHRGLTLKLYEAVERAVIKRTDVVLCVDRKTLEFYRSRYPGASERIVWVPNAVDTAVFKPMDRDAARAGMGLKKDAGVVLFVGRLSREKGLDLLLDAYPALRERVPGAIVVLVGDGPERERLEQRVEKEGLKGVLFRPPAPYAEVPAVMNCADVLALTSESEGFPTVVLEALSCDVPVVATSVGDIPAIIEDGRNGFLLRERDPAELAKRLGDALEAKESTGGFRCRDSIMEYSWEKVAARISGIYGDAVASKGKDGT